MARVPRHTELQNLVLAKSTRQKYDNATTKFLEWCEDNDEDADTAEELDEVLNEYIHHLYHSGGSKSTAINALYGVARYLPGNNALLPLSRRAIRGWSKATPPTPWAPLTWDLTVTRLGAWTSRGDSVGVRLPSAHFRVLQFASQRRCIPW